MSTQGELIEKCMDFIRNKDILNTLIYAEKLKQLNLLDQQDINGSICVIEAACYEFHDAVEQLISMGANVNVRDRSGDTALAWAVTCNNMSMIKFLLYRGADPNLKVDNDATSLIVAAKHAGVEVIGQLLDAGAHIDACDAEGKNAIHEAMAEGKFVLAEYLFRKGSNPFKEDYNYTSAYTIAIRHKRQDLIDLFRTKEEDWKGSVYARYGEV